MPEEQSKPVEPTSGGAQVANEPTDTAKGKQVAVESEDEDAPEGTTTDGAAGAKKKKKPKRKKAKELLTGKSDGVEPSSKNPIDGLTDQQIKELISFNPSLAQELGVGAGADASPEKIAEALKKMNLTDIMTGLASSGKNVKDMASYKFWGTQPVPRFGEDTHMEEGPLQIQKVEDVSTTPPPLVDGFEWVEVDITKDDEMKEVYELLNGHYVEDDEAMFRFNYSTSLLRW
jgi:glycylpeptide N-tetradecanoyltransferase